MNFPLSVFNLLILASLLLMSVGATALIVMLINDIRTKKLW